MNKVNTVGKLKPAFVSDSIKVTRINPFFPFLPPTPCAFVLGRFQPFHPGHQRLIEAAFASFMPVVVCIGSAQASDPFSGEERFLTLEKFLKTNFASFPWRLNLMNDPLIMKEWPFYTVSANQLAAGGVLYRGSTDALTTSETKALKELGLKVNYIEKAPFSFSINNSSFTASSATEVKKIFSSLKQNVTTVFK